MDHVEVHFRKAVQWVNSSVSSGFPSETNFEVWHPAKYAELLAEKMAKHNVNAGCPQ